MTDLEKLLAETTPGPWVWQAEDECLVGPEQIVLVQDDEGRKTFAKYPDGMHFNNARMIALAPQLASALVVAEKALRPFSEMAGEMFAANWNDDGVAISFVTKDGPMRITFKEFREARAALADIAKLTGGVESDPK